MAAEFPALSVSHIMLGVASVDASLEFYRNKLGLAVEAAFPGFAILNAGNGLKLMLAEPLAKNAEHITGATEFVFAVPDVRAAHAALKARGVAFINEPRPVNPPHWAANLRDPDGHLLSIYGPESA
jgi:catechol 2,3-dioxygenase-like lactoylglutathione lyase family enzyme